MRREVGVGKLAYLIILTILLSHDSFQHLHFLSGLILTHIFMRNVFHSVRRAYLFSSDTGESRGNVKPLGRIYCLLKYMITKAFEYSGMEVPKTE